MMMQTFRRLSPSILPAALILVAAFLFGCAQPEPEPVVEETVGERVENADLNIAIAELDSFFRVVSNQDSKIVLEPADGTTLGQLEILSESDSVNLVASIEDHKADLSARENGEYSGQRELMLEAFGTAFYSRGRFTAEDGTAMEEAAVFTLHPRGGRLDAIYVYPAGDDSAARLQDQLFAVVAELVYYEPATVETTDESGASESETEAPAQEADGAAAP